MFYRAALSETLSLSKRDCIFLALIVEPFGGKCPSPPQRELCAGSSVLRPELQVGVYFVPWHQVAHIVKADTKERAWA